MGDENKIGILAYGSLIQEPGAELEPHVVARISCKTPFEVEFARTSVSRGGAPTLIPYPSGAKVSAVILVLNLDRQAATDRLYRREIGSVGQLERRYRPRSDRGPNEVQVLAIDNFGGIDLVLYTSIGCNLDHVVPSELARLAVSSAKRAAPGRDGISYLINAQKAGITTPLMSEYELEILRITRASNLNDALLHASRPDVQL